MPVTDETKDPSFHIQFISDLITTQTLKPKDILYIDIKNNPEEFLEKLMQFTAHSILTLTTYRQSSMLSLHDPLTTSHDLTLRDLIFVLRSGFSIVKRS
jgi:hypothetical protein